MDGDIRVLDVGGLPTEVQSWTPDDASDPPFFVVMIPGNPGGVEPYAVFMQKLFLETKRRFHLVTLGHAGHSARTATSVLFDLRCQIEHKRTYLHGLLSEAPNARVILAGHSVGAHVVVECMRTLPPERIARGLLLFPTLLDIGSTPNGRRLTPVFDYLRGPLWLAMHAVAQLPASWQRQVLRFGAGSQADEEGISSLQTLVHPDVLANALFMAQAEMREIRELDRAHFAEVAPKVVLYFGQPDGWVDEQHPDMFAKTFPSALTVRCDEGHGHSFVLSRSSSERLGGRTAEWVLAAVAAAPPTACDGVVQLAPVH